MAWWKKVVVMAGGPTVNLAHRVLPVLGVFATYGNLARAGCTPVVATSRSAWCPYAEEGRACTAAGPGTPGEARRAAGGDRILSFNGVAVTDWEQLQRLIRANADGEATLLVERGR
jgi:membrane-associated protease RseP (regulator of RpoE activity)